MTREQFEKGKDILNQISILKLRKSEVDSILSSKLFKGLLNISVKSSDGSHIGVTAISTSNLKKSLLNESDLLATRIEKLQENFENL